MIWLNYIVRTLKKDGLRSLCIMVTVLIFCLLILSMEVMNNVLDPSTAQKNIHILTVANRTAPFLNDLPLRLGNDLEQVGGIKVIAPLTITAVSYGSQIMPVAVVGTDLVKYFEINGDGLGLDLRQDLPSIRGRGAIFGRALAAQYGLSLGDEVTFSILKSLIPNIKNHISLRVDGIYSDTSGRGKELQVITSFKYLSQDIFLPKGRTSAFLVQPLPNVNIDLLAETIDAQSMNTPTPTITGNQQIVASNLMAKFIDIRSVSRYAILVSCIMFFAILVGASYDMLSRDRQDIKHIRVIGFSAFQCAVLSFSKWMGLILIGLLIGGLQIALVAFVIISVVADIPPTIIPSLQSVATATSWSLALAATSYLMSSLIATRHHKTLT